MRKKSKKRILVIDDSRDMRALLKLLFKTNGYVVDCTSNGKEALSLLRVLPDLPDLILLDAQMPVMDGYQFRVQQSQDANLKDIPVIVMSGHDDMAMERRMMGPVKIWIKPLHIRSVLKSISSILKPLAS